MKRLDTYLEKAIQNINEDREITRELLDDVVRYLSKDESRHKEVGITAAKYHPEKNRFRSIFDGF